MQGVIVHFDGEESKVAHRRLKAFVKIIGDGTQIYILSFGATATVAT